MRRVIWRHIRRRIHVRRLSREVARASLPSTQDIRVGAGRKIMHESTIQKSATACTVRSPQKRLSMRARCIAWSAVLMFANLPLFVFAQPTCPGIHVKILKIRNSTGTVACALFESPEGCLQSRNEYYDYKDSEVPGALRL